MCVVNPIAVTRDYSNVLVSNAITNHSFAVPAYVQADDCHTVVGYGSMPVILSASVH